VLRALFLKFIYNELNKEEFEVFLLHSEVTEIIPIYFAILAKFKGYSMKNIRWILENISYPNFKQPSYREYLSLKDTPFLVLKRTGSPPKRSKPYSGYVKGYKNSPRNSLPEVEPIRLKEGEAPSFKADIDVLLGFLESTTFSTTPGTSPGSLLIKVSEVT
jgi:hypothetical protein